MEGEQSENENKCVSYTHVCAGIHLNPNLLLGLLSYITMTVLLASGEDPPGKDQVV